MECKPLKIFFSKTYQQNSIILHTHGPWACAISLFKWWCPLDLGCVIKVCSSDYNNNNVTLYNITIIVRYNV